jgi:hypothetical protein
MAARAPEPVDPPGRAIRRNQHRVVPSDDEPDFCLLPFEYDEWIGCGENLRRRRVRLSILRIRRDVLVQLAAIGARFFRNCVIAVVDLASFEEIQGNLDPQSYTIIRELTLQEAQADLENSLMQDHDQVLLRDCTYCTSYYLSLKKFNF